MDVRMCLQWISLTITPGQSGQPRPESVSRVNAPNMIKSNVRNSVTHTSLRYLSASLDTQTMVSGNSAASIPMMASWISMTCILNQTVEHSEGEAGISNGLKLGLYSVLVHAVSLQEETGLGSH